jgi:hypothetical protein
MLSDVTNAFIKHSPSASPIRYSHLGMRSNRLLSSEILGSWLALYAKSATGDQDYPASSYRPDVLNSDQNQ